MGPSNYEFVREFTGALPDIAKPSIHRNAVEFMRKVPVPAETVKNDNCLVSVTIRQ
jgi:hypothetical protein